MGRPHFNVFMLAMCGLTTLISRTRRQLNSTCVVLLQRVELTKLSCRIQAFDLDQGSDCSTLPPFGQRDLWYCCTKLSHKVREVIYSYIFFADKETTLWESHLQNPRSANGYECDLIAVFALQHFVSWWPPARLLRSTFAGT